MKKKTTLDMAILFESPTTDLPVAAAFIGISRATAYALVKEGNFPCRIIRAGNRIIVPTSALRELLGIEAAA